jgi:phosphate/sulfate permease
MAIGDAISVTLGSGTVAYQPSSGVETQIMAFSKTGTTDNVSIQTSGVNFCVASVSGITETSAGKNISYMFTNSVYPRKEGTTDTVWLSGVETNA